VSGGSGDQGWRDSSHTRSSARVVIRRAVDFDYRMGSDLVWRKRDNSATLASFIAYFEAERVKVARDQEASRPACAVP
jgi:hypothetical protein